MSIWVNREHIGTDDRGTQDDPPDNRGVVLSYAEGFSNHYPNRSGNHEQPSAVLTSYIPAWCVPGHSGDERDERPGPWLRLDVYTHEHDKDGKPTGVRKWAAVVLDIDAARSLAQDLHEWANSQHVSPVEPS